MPHSDSQAGSKRAELDKQQHSRRTRRLTHRQTQLGRLCVLAEQRAEKRIEFMSRLLFARSLDSTRSFLSARV